MAISQHTTSRTLRIPPFHPGESRGSIGQFQIRVDEAVPFLNLTEGMILLMDSALEPVEGDVVLVSIKSRPHEGRLIGQVFSYVGGGMGVVVAYQGQRRSAGCLTGLAILGVMAGSFQPRRGVNVYRDSNRTEDCQSEAMKEVVYG